MTGGYDKGYKACPCFWGSEPGSLINKLQLMLDSFSGLSVLDIGCGEGKNAIHFARQGASVKAFDISELALENAKVAWPDYDSVEWQCVDIREESIDDNSYDVIIAYGLLHCLPTTNDIQNVAKKVQAATMDGGYNIVCAFNNRHQDLSAHPEFSPTLASHEFYVGLYQDWELIHVTDEDLHETHPHNNIPHTHSMTRFIARKSMHIK